MSLIISKRFFAFLLSSYITKSANLNYCQFYLTINKDALKLNVFFVSQVRKENIWMKLEISTKKQF